MTPDDSPDLPRRTGLLAALAALTSGCSASAALNAVVPRSTYRGREGVAYGPHPRQRLDIYEPLEKRARTAVALFFYGGSWSSGSRADYRFVGEALASAGVVALVADYRLSPQVRWQEILRDCAAAARWTHDHLDDLGGAGAGLYLMGHSAGAYNVAMLALDPRWLQAQGMKPAQLAGWIGIAGPYDFLPIVDPATRVAFNWPDTPANSQPIQHVSNRAPRTLLMAAVDDTIVDPQRSTVTLGRRLEAAGVDVRVRLFSGVSHVTVLGAVARPLSFLAPVLDEILVFLGAPGG